MDFSTLTLDELNALLEEKRLAGLEIIKDDTIADRVAQTRAIMEEREAILTEINARTEAANEADALLAELEAEGADPEGEPVVEPVAEVVEPEAEPVVEPEAEPVAEVVEPAAVPVPVAAASRVRRVARTSSRPDVPEAAQRPGLTITASANVPDITMGSALDGIRGISTALTNRLSGFTPPQGDGKSENLQKFGIAKIGFSYDDDLTIKEGRDHQQVMERASDVRRLSREGTLEAGSKSLVAAGWCAPSETLYDLCEGETLDGLVSLPEINVSRGGINYTRGPQFADFYGGSGPGFVQTETQAIANTAKTCVTVSCPAFQEVRLDAIGLCIKTPILTESAYPELTDRFTRGSLVAFEHQINADVIGRMEALSNANRTITGLGAVIRDSLEGLELLANEKREKFRLGLTEVLEVVIPFWVKAAFKSDLRSRWGKEAPVTDAEIDAHFASINLNVQWVYDWQPIGQTALVYPTTYRVLMYKAGTFVKGTTDVINLSAVYDAASLAVNTYTGLFMERGLLVARMCWDADRVTLPICTAGRVGAANLTCA